MSDRETPDETTESSDTEETTAPSETSETSDPTTPSEESDGAEPTVERPAAESPADTEIADRETAASEPMSHERDRSPASTDATADESSFARVRRYVQYATLGALLLLGGIALLQFYFSASNAITTWIEPEYRNLFRMAFNLAVLLLAGAGISLQLRRMGAGRSGE